MTGSASAGLARPHQLRSGCRDGDRQRGGSSSEAHWAPNPHGRISVAFAVRFADLDVTLGIAARELVIAATQSSLQLEELLR